VQVAADTCEAQPRLSDGVRVRPLTLRLVLSLALFPIVPSGSIVLTQAFFDLWTSWPAWVNDIQLWMFCATVVSTLLSVSIWRACVVWTAGRYAGTVIAAAVPLAQVLWWKPLWQAGCVSEEVLRVGQSTGMIGLWAWGTIWVWWGWTKLGPSVRRRLRMSDSARRVLLSLGSVPVIVGGYLITLVLFEEEIFADNSFWYLRLAQVTWTLAVVVLLAMVLCFIRGQTAARRRIPMLASIAVLCGVPWVWSGAMGEMTDFRAALAYSNLVWAVVAILSWLLIWRTVVLWSPATRTTTCGLALAFLGLAVAAPSAPPQGNSGEIYRVMVPIMAWGWWIIATTSLWQFQEVALRGPLQERLCCSSCGYSLRGLYGTRCPECGEQPTLDELVTSIIGANDA